VLAKIGNALEWLLVAACIGVILGLEALQRWRERRQSAKWRNEK